MNLPCTVFCYASRISHSTNGEGLFWISWPSANKKNKNMAMLENNHKKIWMNLSH